MSGSLLNTCQSHHSLFLWTTFTTSSIPNHCLDSTQDSLTLNFTPHIHLTILISVGCNASSFSLFNDHFSLPCNVQLCTCVINFSQQQGNMFGSEEKVSELNFNQPLGIMAVTAASASPSTDNKITELIHYFYTRTIINFVTRLYFTISWTSTHTAYKDLLAMHRLPFTSPHLLYTHR